MGHAPSSAHGSAGMSRYELVRKPCSRGRRPRQRKTWPRGVSAGVNAPGYNTDSKTRRRNINKLKPVPEWTPNPRPPDDTSTFQEHRSWLQLQIVLLICRFTPTCPEVVRILSLGMDKQLSLMVRMKLRIHYLMCSFCQRYMKQLKYIREVSREFPEKIGDVSDASLSADAKEQIKAALRQ